MTTSNETPTPDDGIVDYGEDGQVGHALPPEPELAPEPKAKPALGHDYVAVTSIGQKAAEARLRCTRCMRYKDSNPGANCASDEPQEFDDYVAGDVVDGRVDPDWNGDPVPGERPHEFRRVKSIGSNTTRMRCVQCLQYIDSNPGPCLSETSPLEQIAVLCEEIDDTLGTAIGALIEGYEGKDGEGPAHEAGCEVAGRLNRPASFLDMLEFLVTAEPLGLQVKDGAFVVQHGRTSVSNKSLEDAIRGLHQKARPPCPSCGSRTYRQCFGTFTDTFTAETCDQCPGTRE